MNQLTELTIGFQCWSPAQLYEVVVDFFSNHLNVANNADNQVWVRHTMDRDVIRKHAFGKFSEMLVASARNPAMLLYLNLAESTKQLPNENYGREVLELHTIGLNYTEIDVLNSARVLTGRTLNADATYYFDPSIHYQGPIRVLGFSHANAEPAQGERVGDLYLKYLAEHPLTANNLARKLCVRFVSDNPSTRLVESVASAYLANHTAVLPTIRTIFESPEFWASRYMKERRPSEDTVASLRILDVGIGRDTRKSIERLHWMLMAVNDLPLAWVPPTGYPDVADGWRSSSNLLTVWRYHRQLVLNAWKNELISPPLEGLYGRSKPATSGEAIGVLCQRLLGGQMSTSRLVALQKFVGEPASTPIVKSHLKWILPHLVPLILDSPYHAQR